MTCGSPSYELYVIRIKKSRDKFRGSHITAEGWMTIAKKDLRAALTCLAERFPQTFVPEGHQPHRPLKVGIAADLVARCAELDRRKLGAVLSAYTQRIMYRKAMVAGAARVDLDGNPAGEVSAADAEHAAAKLADTLASRQAKQAATEAARRAERIVKHPAVPAPPAATYPAARTLKERPVLRLPAFRPQCG
jgi:sRNA-binding protein